MQLPNTIPFFDDIPIHIHICNIDSANRHWHQNYEILFILSGQLTVITDIQQSILQAEDIILINSQEAHELISHECRALQIWFDYEDIKYIEHTQDLQYDLNSAGNTHSPKFNFIRHLISQFIKVNVGISKRYKTLSLLYSLIDELNESFRILNPQSNSTKKYKERLSSILKYIDEHYREGLTLNHLAAQQNLSAPYLSAFFEKNMGQTFLSYYNDVRLKHALNDLLDSDESIENIALQNGFRDSRSFVSLFKKTYNCLPSVYRKERLIKKQLNAFPNQVTESILDQTENDMAVIGKYLSLNEESNSLNKYTLTKKEKFIEAGTISILDESVTLSHYYHTFCAVGSAKQLLYKEVQDMLRRAQKEIGYKYIKFHGILSDEMMVYTEDANGLPKYSFVLIDKAIDFLMEINLKPLVQLSFMPIALASDPDKMIDMNHFNTSPPKDIKKWTDLVQAFIKHLIQRYGITEIRTWLYCVWNEPDTDLDLFGWNDQKLFFDFYAKTYHAVKEIDPHLQFGTPSMLLLPHRLDDWANNFMMYSIQNHCVGDFLNVHYYDNAFENAKLMMNTGNMNKNIALNTDEFAFSIYINELKKRAKLWGIQNIPIYMTEWNLTISHRDLINDTCFKSCYIAKNILDNYDRLQSFCYWSLTDFIEELQPSDHLFHGGLGLFTYNAIPKANYNIFLLLNKLGAELIAKGNGYFITRSPYKIVIMLYNYEHYSKLTQSFDIMTDITGNSSFTDKKIAHFYVKLTDIPANICLIKELFVNDDQGSSFEAWLKMGAQPMDTPEDLEYLRQSAHPGLYLHRENVSDGCLEIHSELAPYEVRLLEITY